MNSISEKLELLGKGLYANIPDVLTLKSIPTSSELEYVGSEDFDKVMLESILPQAIEEKINFYDLFEIDYQYICRCLRILNYGPYFDVNTIFCPDCEAVSKGEYQVNLNTIECIPLPKEFKNEIIIKRDEFMDYQGDVVFSLPTIRTMLSAYEDKMFKHDDGHVNREMARLCYTIKSLGTKQNCTPVDVLTAIKHDFSPADYIILKNTARQMSDYGLRAGGTTQCPACRSMNAKFIALADDRFFRPSMGNLKQWKLDKSKRRDEDAAGNKTAAV